MQIVELQLNKGIDILAVEIDKTTGEPIYKILGSGLSIAKTVIKLNLYGDGILNIKFKVHEAFVDQDYKKYMNRISKLIALDENIKIIHEPLQECINDHLFTNYYVMRCEYIK